MNERERTPVTGPSLEGVRVLVPSLALSEWQGWLCRVCLRVPLADRRPWSWFGCEYCRGVDARVASELGGKRLLPLGQHSMMNGVGVRLDDVRRDGVSAPKVRAAFDQLLAMGGDWKIIGLWRDHLAAITVEQWRCEHPGDVESVPLADWMERYPAGSMASSVTYLSLLERHYPWILELVPDATDVRWLSGVQPDE